MSAQACTLRSTCRSPVEIPFGGVECHRANCAHFQEEESRMRVGDHTITLGELALCVIAACVVWALIHGWG